MRKIVVVAAVLMVSAVLLYYATIAAVAYIQAPRRIASILNTQWMPLRLEDVPDEYIRDLLAVEDPNFFAHHGIDFSSPGAGKTTITLSKVKQSVLALVLDERIDKK